LQTVYHTDLAFIDDFGESILFESRNFINGIEELNDGSFLLYGYQKFVVDKASSTDTFWDGVPDPIYLAKGHPSDINSQISGGLEESSPPITALFPNPNNGEFIFEISGKEDCRNLRFVVVNAQGKIVHESQLDRKIKVSTNSWPKGVYFWKATCENTLVEGGQTNYKLDPRGLRFSFHSEVEVIQLHIVEMGDFREASPFFKTIFDKQLNTCRIPRQQNRNNSLKTLISCRG